MPNSLHSSSASASCRPLLEAFGGRLDWRPSRLLAAMLFVLGALAALSLPASDLPRWLAWPAVPPALVWGLWLARRELRRAPLPLVWRGDGLLWIEAELVQSPQLQWRGPLAFLAWHDAAGRRRRLAWWPDTLDPAARRELRLAAAVAEAARPRGTMAP